MIDDPSLLPGDGIAYRLENNTHFILAASESAPPVDRRTILADESRLDIVSTVYGDPNDVSPDPFGTQIVTLGRSILDIQGGTFYDQRIRVLGESSVRIRGGEFLRSGDPFGSPAPNEFNLILRNTDSGPGPGDPENGRVQLFVQEIFSVTDRQGFDLGYSNFGENFTLDTFGSGPEADILLSGIWANGDEFQNFVIRPQSFTGVPGFINVWQADTQALNLSTGVDLNAEGVVSFDLLENDGPAGLSVALDPAGGTGGFEEFATFSAEFVNGHASQLVQEFHDRGIPALTPEVGINEGFEVWFLDYDGELEENSEITLTFDYDPADYDDPTRLIVYHYDDDAGVWEELLGELDEDANTITVTTDNLSPFLLGLEGTDVTATIPVPEPTTLVATLGLLGLLQKRRSQTQRP
ncbi:MAG: PEP-CTERM sorting domain-containing protein [Planctomycetota bacterium]